MTTQQQTTFGQRLRAARNRAVLSTRELAKKSGLGNDTIVRLENDLQAPRAKTVRDLAKALEINPQELLGEQELLTG